MKSTALTLLSLLAVWTGAACGQAASGAESASEGNSAQMLVADSVAYAELQADSLRVAAFPLDSVPEADRKDPYGKLTDEDFRIVAEELGVEVAAIKAVVSIETGKEMKGFCAPGVPFVNFDASMYRIYGPKAKDRAADKEAKVPAGLSGYSLREWTQLTNARHTNKNGADMGTFWGMFQIGGFNYKLCGCKDVDEFVRLMSESSFTQLELFAKFITNTGMLKDLKAKNWASFARKYNGQSYAKRGYHTKMAAAYNRFKK